MQVGTLLRARNEDKLFIIVGEKYVIRKTRRLEQTIKGYRVSPCDRMDWSFVVDKYELPKRFEVVS